MLTTSNDPCKSTSLCNDERVNIPWHIMFLYWNMSKKPPPCQHDIPILSIRTTFGKGTDPHISGLGGNCCKYNS